MNGRKHRIEMTVVMAAYADMDAGCWMLHD
jgi:hypothetical protein